jgi:hypothetical protein
MVQHLTSCLQSYKRIFSFSEEKPLPKEQEKIKPEKKIKKEKNIKSENKIKTENEEEFDAEKFIKNCAFLNQCCMYTINHGNVGTSQFCIIISVGEKKFSVCDFNHLKSIDEYTKIEKLTEFIFNSDKTTKEIFFCTNCKSNCSNKCINFSSKVISDAQWKFCSLDCFRNFLMTTKISNWKAYVTKIKKEKEDKENKKKKVSKKKIKKNKKVIKNEDEQNKSTEE